jgi:Capsule polysaccharide biosynthesis protein
MSFVTRLRKLGDKAKLQPGPLDRVAARARRPLDRAFEVRALALDGLAALSADVASSSAVADRDEVSSESPRVLVASLRGWSSHNAYELLIAHALRLRGAQVALLTCGGGMPACELGRARRAHPQPCDRCAWLTDQVVEVAGLKYFKLRDLLPWGEDPRRAPVEPVGGGAAELRTAATVNAEWLLRSTQLDRVPGAHEVANDFAVAAEGVQRATEAVFDAFEPDVVFLLNGLFGAERAIRELALTRGIRAPTYEVAPRAGALVLSQDAAAPDFDLDQLWATVGDKPLSDRQRSEVVAMLNDRARGVGAHESYYDRPEDDPDVLRRRLGLHDRQPVVSLFTNVTWDTATIGHDIGFTSMFDWVEHAVRLTSRTDRVLVVRIHPAEGRWGTRDDIQGTITSRLGEIPANVRFVSAQDALSSYALLDISDLLLTYTTTIGLEAAARGKRVAVAGDTHYRGRGFTMDVSGPADLARFVAIEPAPLPAKNVELAVRYAHMFFFRAMIPFPLIDARDGKVRRLPRRAAELAPGANPYLDWICERILDGGHFGLPDELAGARLPDVRAA